MKLFEYQAKQCFRACGIAVPEGETAETPDEAMTAASRIGFPCMIKSQILRGGRGKLGLVKRADDAKQSELLARQMLGSAYGVQTVLVEACVDSDEEVYLSFSIDAAKAKAVAMLCASGGVEIETLARKDPGKIHYLEVDLLDGIQSKAVSAFVDEAGFHGAAADSLYSLVEQLYACFCKYDAELAEINPIRIGKDGQVWACDGKLSIDDNSVYRQTEFQRSRAYFNNDMEYEAAEQGIPYIQFDGDISLMCAGAGLTNTVFDLIHYEGGTVANYLEFGGPNYMKSEKALELCLKNKSEVILIVTFGTIARADVIAEGVVNASAKLHPDRPIITCIRGTNEEEAGRMLHEAGFPCFSDTEEAIRYAIALVKERKRK